MEYWDDKGKQQHMQGSYTFNGYGLRSDPAPVGQSVGPLGGDDATLVKSNNARNLAWLLVPPLKRTGETPIIFDGTWPTAWPKETDGIDPANGGTSGGVVNLYNNTGNAAALDITNNWRRLLIARHGMAINVGFLDGHAVTVQLPDLWSLQWHTGWDLKNLPAGNTQATIRAYIRRNYKG